MISPNSLRKHILNMIYLKKSGHWGGSASIAELIAYLYNEYNLAHRVDEPGDLLVLSKGHGVPIVYAAQIESGLFPIDQITTFRETGSPFQGHPDIRFNEYIHALTGSLGQGLSIACGMALAKKIKKEDGFVFCVVGDGELNEGTNYEALMFANKFKLDNLVVFLDNNDFQNDAGTDETMPIDFDSIIPGFGWNYAVVTNGNNYDALLSLGPFLSNPGSAKFIRLDTIKGKGVSFMEGKVEWHSKIPSEIEYELALKELDNG